MFPERLFGIGFFVEKSPELMLSGNPFITSIELVVINGKLLSISNAFKLVWGNLIMTFLPEFQACGLHIQNPL
jgi:hypothetical protein